ncbi:MAG: RdgB/HAM1 family non-canonical purine NTP pyrophosphatase [Bryobacterales bacterium]|nr:RdgB/HAM1 family non-canonical purine NTP pyrophosphatase [Bryobacteraceae bacterium]MDW8131385.1 RdgB/HAM1 family non-canonical purine NTP pyrophosphatase [Bryobacterales bacterium]
MILYCATTNAGKLREFRLAAQSFAGGRIRVEQLPDLGRIPPCEETGSTFEENAIQKALYYSRLAPGLLFAEDSGLEVNALGGAPGVFSARFAGPAATDEANNRLLLEKLRGIEDRSARYVCVAALAEGGRLIRTFSGAVAGRILESPRGSGGFGYDPLFYYEPFGATFAEVSAERKMAVSHRGQALRQMFEWLAAGAQEG